MAAFALFLAGCGGGRRAAREEARSMARAREAPPVTIITAEEAARSRSEATPGVIGAAQSVPLPATGSTPPVSQTTVYTPLPAAPTPVPSARGEVEPVQTVPRDAEVVATAPTASAGPRPAHGPDAVQAPKEETSRAWITANRQGEQDVHGFTSEGYMALLTEDEVDVLRLRARGDTQAHLAEFLTDREKDNLRRRAAELTEIASDPLRIGE